MKIDYENYKDNQDEVREKLIAFCQENGISAFRLTQLLKTSRQTIDSFIVKKNKVSYKILCKVLQFLKDQKD